MDRRFIAILFFAMTFICNDKWRIDDPGKNECACSYWFEYKPEFYHKYCMIVDAITPKETT